MFPSSCVKQILTNWGVGRSAGSKSAHNQPGHSPLGRPAAGSRSLSNRVQAVGQTSYLPSAALKPWGRVEEAALAASTLPLYLAAAAGRWGLAGTKSRAHKEWEQGC